MRRVTLYESSMVGSYSDVHCERTSRKVIELLPHPPSPHIVMLMGTGGWGSDVGRMVKVDGCQGLCFCIVVVKVLCCSPVTSMLAEREGIVVSRRRGVEPMLIVQVAKSLK